MNSTAEVVKVKDAFAWIETQRNSIALRATTRDGKPVELTAAEARLFSQRLARLADVLESQVEQEQERQDS